jgi:hypothetical protein
MHVLIYTDRNNKYLVQHRTGTLFKPISKSDLVSSARVHTTLEEAAETLKIIAGVKRKKMRVCGYDEVVSILGLK